MRYRTLVVLVIGVALVAAGLLWRRSAPGGASADEEPEAPTVVAVHVAPVVRTTLRGYVTAWGTVEPQQATRTRPPASARIAALVPGLVAEVRCAEGQRVAQGAVLFQLDTRVADIAVAQGRQAVEYAEQVFERQKKLGPGEATSQRLYQEAEQNLAVARNELRGAEAQRALLTITTPLAGTVVRVNAKPGDTVDLTTVLAEVVDLDRLVVGAVVRSADVPRLTLDRAGGGRGAVGRGADLPRRGGLHRAGSGSRR
jgi:multidrug efflux pump subunit AcrA (membrane-fusion protein)